MREQVLERLQQLSDELATGQKMVAEREQKRADFAAYQRYDPDVGRTTRGRSICRYPDRVRPWRTQSERSVITASP
jgi:hypothetical protein